jgi:hypothetical protein
MDQRGICESVAASINIPISAARLGLEFAQFSMAILGCRP